MTAIKINENDVYTPEEIAANRRVWVEALRSGEYEQGAGQLETPEGRFCCLGVAQRLAGLPTRHVMGAMLLPDYTVSWAVGLPGDCSVAGRRLPDLNDVERWTFAQIADLIEGAPIKVTR